MNDNYREELALNEMRRSYDEYNKAADTLDQKVNSLLTSASLIISLFGLLQLKLMDQVQSPLYKTGIVLVFVLYLTLVSLISNIISPKTYKTPIKPKWEVLDESLLTKKKIRKHYSQ